MEQSLDTTKQPSPSDSSKNGMTYINNDLSLDELRNFVNQKAEEESVIEFIGNNTNDGCTLRGKQDDKISSKKPSSSLEVINEDSDTDMEEVLLPDIDQFEEYPSSYEEFCDQFDFKVKGRGVFMLILLMDDLNFSLKMLMELMNSAKLLSLWKTVADASLERPCTLFLA
ncbi:hypothetical protein Tco_0757451 [Tanacetum coccineum]